MVAEGDTSPAISVVIPTAGRTDLLIRCLEALLRQDFPGELYEIIIVDDGVHPSCRDAVLRMAIEKSLTASIAYLFNPSSSGPAAARNKGWRKARAPVVAFTDDDCVPQVSWLSSGLGAITEASGINDARRPEGFSTDNLAAVSGRILVPIPPVPTDYQKDVSGLERAEFVTANCFYRRDVIEALGGFDERFKEAWREDADLYLSLIERGCRVACVPKAVVIHPVRNASWGASLKGQAKHRFNALLYKKHRGLYWERIQPSPPWNYYQTLGALGVAAAAVLTRRKRAFGASMMIWLFLTLRFAFRRLRGTSHAFGHVIEMVTTSALIPPLAIFWRLNGAVRFRVWFL